MASKQGNEAATEDVGELLDIVDSTLDRLKTLYEQYFLGIQKQPPTFIHADVERKLRDLTQLQVRNTGLRYRLATLQQKFGSYNSYWRRTLRQIENGTYMRNLSKIGREAIRTGADIPEEILAAMPKRMRDQVIRDREQALAVAKRRSRTDSRSMLPPEPTDELVAMIKEPTDVRRSLRTQNGAHVLEESDGELDIDAFFEAVQYGTIPPPVGKTPANIAKLTATVTAAPPGPPGVPPTPAPRAATAPPVPPSPKPRAATAPLVPPNAHPRAATSPGAQPPPVPPPQPPRAPTGAQPAFPRPGTGAQPALPRPGTGAQPALPRPGTGAQPALPRPGTGAQPALPRPGTGAQPALPRPGTGAQPALPRPGTGAQPAIAQPGTGAQPAIAQPGTGVQPAIAQPGTGAQPAIAQPGTGAQPAIPPPRAPTEPHGIPAIPRPAASQASRPNPIAPGAAAAHGSVQVESLAGPFPRERASTPPTGVPALPNRAPTPPTGVPALPNRAPTPPTGVAALPKRAPTPPPVQQQRPPPGMTDADVNALYAKYVKAKEMVGEKIGPGEHNKLLKTINAQAPKIMEQYKAKAVDFSVVVKDNQVIIRAKPKT